MPSLAPRLSLAVLLIFVLGGAARAQSPALTSRTYDIRDSAGNTLGTVDVVASSSSAGCWTTDIGGTKNMGSYAWDTLAKAYRSFRNTDPPSPVADVWWDGVTGVWRWRDIVTGQVGTLH